MHIKTLVGCHFCTRRSRQFAAFRGRVLYFLRGFLCSRVFIYSVEGQQIKTPASTAQIISCIGLIVMVVAIFILICSVIHDAIYSQPGTDAAYMYNDHDGAAP